MMDIFLLLHMLHSYVPAITHKVSQAPISVECWFQMTQHSTDAKSSYAARLYEH